ncbi:MAG TPA: HAMP domain-containing sensor histidine kinase [Vicinamibacterales bacterium]|nr:HAMP domain-containing sensor histidine kinase [Vicinamibacterales bacterium]
MNRLRYRQVFLFLVVLVLPTAAIIIQSRYNASRERENDAQARELARRELADLRRRRATEIGQDIVTRLERIKLQEIARAPSGAATAATASSDSAVAFVGWEGREGLIWPWNVAHSHNGGASREESEFTRKRQAGERAELAEQNYSRAAAFYREALGNARTDAERASASLPLANVLARAGAQAEAARVYRGLLKLPSSVTDDQGLSFASYAALRLSESHAAEALARVNLDLESAALLSPAQAYRWRSVLESMERSGDAAVRLAAAGASARLAKRIADVEDALQVQQHFRDLRVTADSWQPYAGRDRWWIGKAPTGAASRPLVLAVRVEEILRSVETERQARHEPSFQLVTDGVSGESLGEHLPGMRVALGPEITKAVAAPGAGRSFYGLSLFLVVTLTFVGAFFLWRDTRRESRLAELRSQFVSSVSHELKTPLTSIRMFAESLQMDDESGTGDPKERAEYLETIVCESERLTRLLNNVLDFSRIERGQKNYHLQSEELPGVVDAAVRTMRFPLAEQGFDLRVDICDDLPSLRLDRDAIEQAILNLLNNAMKYSGKSREIGLRLSRRNGSALIQVADQGIGIPAGEQRRIFDKFYRVPSKENNAISGTGLGLALVAHIADAHGGTVEVESAPGKGSTFSIALPLPREPAPDGGAAV